MSKDIQISEVLVRTPNVIQVDGVIYPRNQYNVNVVRKYWDTGDEAVLDKLTTVSLDLG